MTNFEDLIKRIEEFRSDLNAEEIEILDRVKNRKPSSFTEAELTRLIGLWRLRSQFEEECITLAEKIKSDVSQAFPLKFPIQF